MKDDKIRYLTAAYALARVLLVTALYAESVSFAFMMHAKLLHTYSGFVFFSLSSSFEKEKEN